jgi:hypothetical protein
MKESEGSTDKTSDAREPDPMEVVMGWWGFISEAKHANAIMAIATVLIFLSGVCYTVFSALQWGANKQSADAATKSAEVAEQALVSVQRAFITQRRVEITPITDAQSKQITGVQIDLGWENNGTTPAKSLTQHISTRWDVNPIPSDFTFPDEWLPGAEHVPQPTYMGPKGALGGGIFFIPVSILKEVQDGKRHVYYWGWARYEDVFLNQHITELCAELKSNGTQFDLGEGFPFRLDGCSRHNCIDEDCKTNQ